MDGLQAADLEFKKRLIEQLTIMNSKLEKISKELEILNNLKEYGVKDPTNV